MTVPLSTSPALVFASGRNVPLAPDKPGVIDFAAHYFEEPTMARTQQGGIARVEAGERWRTEQEQDLWLRK